MNKKKKKIKLKKKNEKRVRERESDYEGFGSLEKLKVAKDRSFSLNVLPFFDSRERGDGTFLSIKKTYNFHARKKKCGNDTFDLISIHFSLCIFI